MHSCAATYVAAHIIRHKHTLDVFNVQHRYGRAVGSQDTSPGAESALRISMSQKINLFGNVMRSNLYEFMVFVIYLARTIEQTHSKLLTTIISFIVSRKMLLSFGGRAFQN